MKNKKNQLFIYISLVLIALSLLAYGVFVDSKNVNLITKDSLVQDNLKVNQEQVISEKENNPQDLANKSFWDILP